MPTTKVSIRIDEDLLAELRERLEPGQLSSYVNDALRRSLQHDHLGELLAQLDEEFGPVPDEIRAEVGELWRRIVLEGEQFVQLGADRSSSTAPS